MRHRPAPRTFRSRRLLLVGAVTVFLIGMPPRPSKAVIQPPEVSIDQPGSITSTAAQIIGSVNPNGDSGTSWRLRLSIAADCTSGYGDLEPHILGSPVPVSVHQELIGLVPSQHYCVQIAAANTAGSSLSDFEQFSTEPASSPTEVSTAFASRRTATTARLNGQANPGGANATYPMTYWFEYRDGGEASWEPLPQHQYTGEARDQIVFGQELTGLTAGHSYRFRFRAKNQLGETLPQVGEVEFKTRSQEEMTQPVRRLELVNNPDKGNQNVVLPPGPQIWAMAEDGESAIWGVSGAAPGGNAPSGNLFLARRTTAGWISHSLIPAPENQIDLEGDQEYNLVASNPTLTRFVFAVNAPKLSEATSIALLDNDGNQSVLREYVTPPEVRKLDLTPASGHVLLVSEGAGAHLDDLTQQGSQILSIMPDGQPNICGLYAGDSLSGEQRRPDYHLTGSANVSHVYFQAIENGSPCLYPSTNAIYERDTQTRSTTLIDPGSAGRTPEIVRASEDGNRLYFVTWTALDPSDGNTNADLYRWDSGRHKADCLTCIVADADLSTGYIASPVLVSDDESHVYFESTRQLVLNQGTPGDEKLYVIRPEGLALVADLGSKQGALPGLLRTGNAYLSSDGGVLVFKFGGTPIEHRYLTADVVAPQCPYGFYGSDACVEAYRYDDRDGSIECISCNRFDETSSSVATPSLPVSKDLQMSTDGSTVAFTTADGLARADINHTIDVYEWRNGEQRLVTNGVTKLDQSNFAAPQVHGIAANGSDILLSMVSPGATGFEQDGQANQYDARLGGGFEVGRPPLSCSGELCQGEPPNPPALAGPRTATAVGARNNRRRRRCRHHRRPVKKHCQRVHSRHSRGPSR